MGSWFDTIFTVIAPDTRLELTLKSRKAEQRLNCMDERYEAITDRLTRVEETLDRIDVTLQEVAVKLQECQKHAMQIQKKHDMTLLIRMFMKYFFVYCVKPRGRDQEWLMDGCQTELSRYNDGDTTYEEFEKRIRAYTAASAESDMMLIIPFLKLQKKYALQINSSPPIHYSINDQQAFLKKISDDPQYWAAFDVEDATLMAFLATRLSQTTLLRRYI